MWRNGNIISIHQRVPNGDIIVEMNTVCKVVKNENGHRCMNCPMQQMYCDINKCEQNLPNNYTLQLVKPKVHSGESLCQSI